jgi:hypothetical protein
MKNICKLKKGKEAHKNAQNKYLESEKGKNAQKESQIKRQQSEEYKTYMREYMKIYRAKKNI